MTNEEMQQIAQRVATSVVSELGGSGAGSPVSGTVGEFTIGDEDASCFTCSGRFRCRPSFLIQAETA
ncbi:hypothetical protein [Yoonia sp. 2307UL14-13]|uniref:hypothetical protein n=1 Tax=Yoonia sp. 2307UL14-13 TaxID=3126506 RepID=UPI0030B44071